MEGSEPRKPRRELSTLVVLLLAACLSLVTAAPAWPHAKLVESHPPGGSVLGEAPEQVRPRFDEPVRFKESAEAEPLGGRKGLERGGYPGGQERHEGRF